MNEHINLRFLYTDGNNSDFIELCHRLDDFLNKLVGGEENRASYIPYNKLDDIHDVILVYDNDIPIGCASFKKYDNECAEVKRVRASSSRSLCAAVFGAIVVRSMGRGASRHLLRGSRV